MAGLWSLVGGDFQLRSVLDVLAGGLLVGAAGACTIWFIGSHGRLKRYMVRAMSIDTSTNSLVLALRDNHCSGRSSSGSAQPSCRTGTLAPVALRRPSGIPLQAGTPARASDRTVNAQRYSRFSCRTLVTPPLRGRPAREVRGATAVAKLDSGRIHAAATGLVDGAVGIVVPVGRLMMVIRVTLVRERSRTSTQ